MHTSLIGCMRASAQAGPCASKQAHNTRTHANVFSHTRMHAARHAAACTHLAACPAATTPAPGSGAPGACAPACRPGCWRLRAPPALLPPPPPRPPQRRPLAAHTPPAQAHMGAMASVSCRGSDRAHNGARATCCGCWRGAAGWLQRVAAGRVKGGGGPVRDKRMHIVVCRTVGRDIEGRGG